MKISLGMELMFTLETIDEAATTFINAVNGRKVIAFHGEMGAGKTTFIHSICRVLGVQNSVSSPTFSIINEYLLPDGRIIYHMDLYRLKDEREAIEAGVEDCILSGKICMVEWPDKAPGLFPDGSLHCTLFSIADNQRKLQINL